MDILIIHPNTKNVKRFLRESNNLVDQTLVCSLITHTLLDVVVDHTLVWLQPSSHPSHKATEGKKACTTDELVEHTLVWLK